MWRSHRGDESDGRGPEAALGDEALKKIEVCHDEREVKPTIKTIKKKKIKNLSILVYHYALLVTEK